MRLTTKKSSWTRLQSHKMNGTRCIFSPALDLLWIQPVAHTHATYRAPTLLQRRQYASETSEMNSGRPASTPAPLIFPSHISSAISSPPQPPLPPNTLSFLPSHLPSSIPLGDGSRVSTQLFLSSVSHGAAAKGGSQGLGGKPRETLHIGLLYSWPTYDLVSMSKGCIVVPFSVCSTLALDWGRCVMNQWRSGDAGAKRNTNAHTYS